MISRTNFTQKIVIVSAIALGLLPYNLANAAGFKIGNVQQTFPTDALCVSLNPKMPDKVILVEVGSAWMNINGKDVELKLVIRKNINSKRTILKFQGKGFTVTRDSTLIRVNKGEDLENSEYQEVITIKHSNTSKVLKLKGYCST